MWHVYILYSKKIDRFYTGYCQDLELRIARHNQGWSKSTKSGIPWELVYHESFEDKSYAIKPENEIKRMKSRKYILGLIENLNKPQ